jgi:hypothetical protein
MTHVSEQSTTFNPETLHILGSALDDAWQRLEVVTMAEYRANRVSVTRDPPGVVHDASAEASLQPKSRRGK